MQAGRLVSRISVSSLAIAAVAFAASCDSARSTDPMAGHNHTNSVTPSNVRFDSDLANQVRSATVRFHSQTQAARAGYELASPCIANPPVGGMGFHWVNGPSVDPVYDPLHPEAVIYDTDGELVAVEYIVIDVGQPRPTFDGRPFDIGGAPLPVAHWTQHVWLYKPNPSGMLNPWNPVITCPT